MLIVIGSGIAILAFIGVLITGNMADTTANDTAAFLFGKSNGNDMWSGFVAALTNPAFYFVILIPFLALIVFSIIVIVMKVKDEDDVPLLIPRRIFSVYGGAVGLLMIIGYITGCARSDALSGGIANVFNQVFMIITGVGFLVFAVGAWRDYYHSLWW